MYDRVYVCTSYADFYCMIDCLLDVCAYVASANYYIYIYIYTTYVCLYPCAYVASANFYMYIYIYIYIYIYTRRMCVCIRVRM